MFIRRTTIKSRQQGEPYYTYRLVESHRVSGKVKQHTLLNLGRHFDVPQHDWRLLALRIEQLLEQQDSLVSMELAAELEDLAQRYTAQILATQSQQEAESPDTFSSVNLDSLKLVRPRRVGIEQLALQAINQLNLKDKFQELGFNRHQLAAALGNIIARMAFPASELASHMWLGQRSGLGELMGYDFEAMGLDRLYQASDQLWKHKDALEKHLYEREQSLFSFGQTITLYDLTNTYFEGDPSSSKARRGRSKEKRSDCPLITLGLVLDGSGFPRSSAFFPGNVSEPATLQDMLTRLNACPGSTVVMDAGIASEDNIHWLIENGYRYLVVSRKRKREFDDEQAIIVKQTPGQTVRLQRVIDTETGEIQLRCHSQAREQKEQAIQDRFSERFENALQSLNEGLSKKGCTKQYDKILERLGRLKEKYARAAQHVEIQVEQDNDSGKATRISWQRKEKAHTQATHPGVYCLRTNLADWDEATLWKTYTMLTELESVFRSLKSELGLRPNYHQKEVRIEGHLFITLLAYHLVHTIRSQLKVQGIHDSWESIRRAMENQQRITISLKRKDGKAIHIRKTTQAEPHQKEIYNALGITSQPGQTQHSIV